MRKPLTYILMAQYTVPERNLGWLREKVEKLNKTATKLGVAPVTMTVVSEFVRQIDEYTASKWATVEVHGEAPVLAGWRFIGTIQHIADNGSSATILRAVPGFQIGEYRDADPNWCVLRVAIREGNAEAAADYEFILKNRSE